MKNCVTGICNVASRAKIHSYIDFPHRHGEYAYFKVETKTPKYIVKSEFEKYYLPYSEILWNKSKTQLTGDR